MGEPMSQNKQELRGIFRSFLINLETFLEVSALTENGDLKVLYLQEPEEMECGFYSKGLVQIGNYAYAFKVSFDYDLDSIEIESKVFHYHLTLDEMKKFLDQVHGGGA
jgi:hypothetical protein